MSLPPIVQVTTHRVPVQGNNAAIVPPIVSSPAQPQAQSVQAQSAQAQSAQAPQASQSESGGGLLAKFARFTRSKTKPNPANSDVAVEAQPVAVEAQQASLVSEVVDLSVNNVAQATAIQTPDLNSHRVARAYHPLQPIAPAPAAAQGSGSRSVLSAPVAGSGTRGFASPTPPTISGTLVTPQSDGTGVPIVQESPTFFDAEQPLDQSVVGPSVVGGCQGCNDGSCGSCQHGGGCNDGLGAPSCNDGLGGPSCDYGAFGSVSAARRYGYFEFLYLSREDGDINNSNFNPLGDFDGEAGWRVTLGQRDDRLSGREITYFGTSPIEATSSSTDPAGGLNALFAPVGGLDTGDLSSFFGATAQDQFKDTVIHSVEANRVRWGWDVLKTFVGFRYLYFADDFIQNSTAPAFDPLTGAFGDESGLFRIDTNNHLVGGQIGTELFYDVGYRFSVSAAGKFGTYVNFNKVDFFLENDDQTLLDTEETNVTISTTWEFSVFAHYQIRPTARFRVGYNALFIGNLATTSDNFTPFVSPFTGFAGNDSDDAFVQGISLGLEIYR